MERGAPDEEEEVMGSLELIEEVEGVRLWWWWVVWWGRGVEGAELLGVEDSTTHILGLSARLR